MILIIDNYDSFTYNLYQAVAVHMKACVLRNDEISLAQIKEIQPTHIIISPGPGHPEEAGICIDMIKQYAGSIPLMGICLGMQAIVCAYGGVITQTSEQMHGEESTLKKANSPLFKGCDTPIRVGRYHSLAANESSLPNDLIIDAESEKGTIMSIRHRSLPCYGLQFHPESILTPCGDKMIKNFLDLGRGLEK